MLKENSLIIIIIGKLLRRLLEAVYYLVYNNYRL